MKRIVFLITFTIFINGCSSEAKQLSYDEIEGLPIEEQVDSIIENTGLIDEYEIIIDGSSVAIVYPTERVHDTTLALSDREESFPNVAMTFVEHLSVLDFDETVITSYEPTDTEMTGLTRVSALFLKDTVEDLDFEEWKSERENRQQRFYRYADAYLIRGNVWESLNDEIQEAIGNPTKDSDSQFWDYYGSYVEK